MGFQARVYTVLHAKSDTSYSILNSAINDFWNVYLHFYNDTKQKHGKKTSEVSSVHGLTQYIVKHKIQLFLSVC